MYPQVQLPELSNAMMKLALMKATPGRGRPRMTSAADETFSRVTRLRNHKHLR